MDRVAEAQTMIAIADAGSISGAARQLGLNKSVVSRRLTALEARLGVGLVHRSTRGLALSEAGEIYRQRAASLLLDWAELEESLGGDGAALSGTVRVAAPLSFGLSHVAPTLLEFQRAHPEVRLDADFSDRVTDLVGEGFDLAIRIGALPDSNLKARRLGRAQVIAAAAPDWLGDRDLERVEDFAGLPELRYSLRSASMHPLQTPDGQECLLRTREAMRSSNGDFLRDAAIAGMGMTILPEFILCDAVREGHLNRVLADHRFEALDIHAVYPAARHQLRHVRALIETIAEAFKGTNGRPPWSLDAQESA